VIAGARGHAVSIILETVTANPIKEVRHPGAHKRPTNMVNNSFRIPTIALALALLAAPATTFAQSGVPTREGNTWDWRDHQPTEAEVLQKEKAAGLAPSQKDSNAATVDELYQQLMRQQTK
jgi:hypothetical protein